MKSRRSFWFLVCMGGVPLLIVVYLMMARPEASPGDSYQTVDLANLVDTQLSPDASSAADIPRAARNLDYHNVMLEGEMLIPPAGTLAANEFLLLPPRADPRDNSKRVVSAPWQFVLVRMPADKRVQPVPGRMRVYGQFHATPLRKPGSPIWSVYQIDCFWTQVL